MKIILYLGLMLLTGCVPQTPAERPPPSMLWERGCVFWGRSIGSDGMLIENSGTWTCPNGDTIRG